MNIWIDEEIRTLVSLWPTHTAVQIAITLHRSCAAIRSKAQQLREKGLLEGKLARSGPTPDPQDFDKAKRDYCCKHNITIAELCARFKDDNQLAAELYRLAQAALVHRCRPA